MENDLDLIANGEKKYYTLCNKCNVSIDNLIKKINKENSNSNENDLNIDKKAP